MKKTGPRSSGEGESADHEFVRERILDAAFMLFTKRGYAATSTLDIATQAKVSKRELYAHFRNKQGMLEAGVAARTRRMRTPLELPKVTTKAALEATLVAFGTTLIREVSHPHVIGLHRIAVAEFTRAPELAATLNEQGRQTNYRVLAGFLKDAQEAGLVDKSEPRVLAAHFMGLLWRDLMTQLMLGVSERPTEKEAEKRARDATAAFLRLHGA